MVVDGTNKRINPPIPADCRPWSTRTMNKMVTVTVKPNGTNSNKKCAKNSLLQHWRPFLSKDDTKSIAQTTVNRRRVTI